MRQLKLKLWSKASVLLLFALEKEIKNKIAKYAFSGGKDTIKLHRELGGNTEVDVSYQWLRHFLEDDKKLADIKQKYESGELLTGELKRICSDVITQIVVEHQNSKEIVTQDIVNKFYTIENINIK